MSHLATPSRFIGCDVGKTAIVVFDTASGRTCTVANDAARPCPASPLRSRRPVSSSARPRAAMSAICWPPSSRRRPGLPSRRPQGQGLHPLVRNARQIRRHRRNRACPIRLDRYAELPLWSAREPERERLQALVLARRDLVKDRLAYANRRTAPAAEPVHPYLEALVESFDAQIKAIEADIQALCAACEPIAKAVNVLVAIQGVGQKTAAALIALMPELGSLPDARPPPSQALRPIPIKAARPTPIAEPAAEDPKSNESCSWPQSPPQNTTPPSAPSTNVSSAQAKSPSSPSPQSCENSSSSQTPNSEQANALQLS